MKAADKARMDEREWWVERFIKGHYSNPRKGGPQAYDEMRRRAEEHRAQNLTKRSV